MPAAVGYAVVIRLRLLAETEKACYRAAVGHNKAPSGVYIRQEVFLGRILALPLIDPVLFEVIARLAHDEHYLIHILRHGLAALHRLCKLHAAALFFDLLNKLQVGFIRQLKLCKHIWALVHSALKAFLAPPARNGGVVTAEEHLRHFPALPDLGARILRIFEHSVPVAFAGEALLIGKNARHEAAYGIGNCHRGKLAAGEHEIAQRYLLIDALLDKALVYALIMAAHEHEMVIVVFKPPCRCLIVGLALRRHVDNAAALALCS